MEINDQKRVFKRKSLNRLIDFELTDKSRRENIHDSGEAINISSGGIGLITTYNLRRGEILKLYLPAIAKSASLPVFSEVVWVKQTDSHVEAGLRFL